MKIETTIIESPNDDKRRVKVRQMKGKVRKREDKNRKKKMKDETTTNEDHN